MFDFYHKPSFKPHTKMSHILQENGYILDNLDHFKYINSNYKYISFLMICLHSQSNLCIKNIDNIESLIEKYIDEYILENYLSFRDIVEFINLSAYYASPKLFSKITKRFLVKDYSIIDKKSIFQHCDSYIKVLYLLIECNISLWDVVDTIYFNKKEEEKDDLETLKKILDTDKLSSFINKCDMESFSYTFKDKFNYFMKGDSRIIIHIYEDIINNITSDKIELVIHQILNSLIIHNNYKVIKYIFSGNIFMDRYFLNTDTYNIVENMKKIFAESGTLYRYSNYSLLTKKIKNQWGSIMNIFVDNLMEFRIENVNDILFERIDYAYDFNILGLLCKLPNTNRVFDKVETNILANIPINSSEYSYRHSFPNSINYAIFDMLRYGYINCIKNMYPKLIKLLKLRVEDEYNYNNYCLNYRDHIKYALYNKDNRTVSFVCQIIEENDPGYINKSENEIELSFMEIIDNEENIIKKMKTLLKYASIKKFRWNFMKYVSSIKFSDKYKKHETYQNKFKLKKWILKKFCNQKIEDIDITSNRFNKFIFDSIILEEDYDLLDEFIKICDDSVNMWQFIIIAVSRNYFWYGNVVNKLLEYAAPLSEQPDSIKEKLIESVVFYSDIKDENGLSKQIDIQSNYNNLVKYLVKNGVCLNNIINKNSYPLCKYLFSNGNEKISYACILNGMSIKPIIDHFISTRIYYLPNIGRDTKKGIIKLYFLIKSLTFRLNYRNKKIHQQYQYSLNCDFYYRPPKYNSSKNLLKKGGIGFYRDRDEFMSFGEDNMEDIKIVNPVHIKPLDFLKIRNKKLYISQKVDGLLVKNIDKDNLYPSISNDLEYSKLDGEYIPELDIYLIFNIRSEEFSFNDYYFNSLILLEEHPIAKNMLTECNLSLDINQDLDKKFEIEFQKIIQFANLNKDKKHKWWPKTFWSINYQQENLNIVDMLEQYQNKVYSKCLNKYLSVHPDKSVEDVYSIPMDTYIQQRTIKTDGIIIMLEDNKKEIYKYKPQRCMTADILNQEDGKIYRNIWRNGWIPYEVREDKVKPNPNYLISELTKYNTNPWTIQDIMSLTKDMVYYHKEDEYDKFTKEYFNNSKKFINNFLGDLFYNRSRNRNTNILDFGCGYQNSFLWKDNELRIDGIDIDLGVLNSKTYSKLKSNKKVFIGNLCENDSEHNNSSNIMKKHYSQNYELSKMLSCYDYIVSLMSIHNCFRNKGGFDNFMEFVNKRTNISSEFLVSFIDEDELFDDDNIVKLPNGSYLRKIESTKDELSWIKMYYSWRHTEVVKEPIISSTKFIKQMRQKGWEIKMEKIIDYSLDISNSWNKVANSTKIFIFDKVN